jgi:hypothetical protein
MLYNGALCTVSTLYLYDPVKDWDARVPNRVREQPRHARLSVFGSISFEAGIACRECALNVEPVIL